MDLRVPEDDIVQKLIDDREFVVVHARHLMSEARIAADVVSVTLLFELFDNGVGSEKSDAEELGLVLIHQFVLLAVTEEGGGGCVVLVFGFAIVGEDGTGV